jgi:murein DD-endopeptidase MepM/ murein hydrolase activator NlpD
MDLYSVPGDTIVALDDGIFMNYAGGYVGLDGIVIQHGDLNVVYGEFISEKGLKRGDIIAAGQKIGTTVNSKGTSQGAVLSSMLHLETWDASVYTPDYFTPWKSDKPMPAGLLDPTRFLQRTLDAQ